MQTGREQNIEETEFNDSTAAEPADIVSESQPGKRLETQPHSKQVTASQSNERVTRATKRKREKEEVISTQKEYNKKVKEARTQKQKFKLEDYVALEINKEDKETPLYPNVLFAQIVELEKDYAKLITKYGFMATFMSLNRLSKIKNQTFHLIVPKKSH